MLHRAWPLAKPQCHVQEVPLSQDALSTWLMVHTLQLMAATHHVADGAMDAAANLVLARWQYQCQAQVCYLNRE